MQINLVYDPSVDNAPPGFKTAMAYAASFLDSLIINPITVNIAVGFGEVDGQPIDGNESEGSENGINLSYTEVRNELIANSTSAADENAVASLPVADPTNGGNFDVSYALAKAWGLIPADGTEIDGYVGFSSTYPDYNYNTAVQAVANEEDFVGVAEHELTHALGRDAGLQYAPNWYEPQDLFRYSSPGVRELVGGKPAYFSINGGVTNLENFATSSDYGDWAASAGNDSFDAVGPVGTVNAFSSADITEMDILGFTIAGAVIPPTISGSVDGQNVPDNASILPFSSVVIGDANGGETETVTISLSAGWDGTLSNLDGGNYDAETGVYSISGILATVNAAVEGLVFTPTDHQVPPGQTVSTTFEITDTDSGGGSAPNATASVIATAVATPPTITGTAPDQATTDQTSIDPFAQVAIMDPNAGQTETVTVTLSDAANGRLINPGGGYNPASGVFQITGSAAVVTAAVDALVFDPTPHQVVPGQTVTTGFTITDSDTAGLMTANSATSVVATAMAAPPTLSGIPVNQPLIDQQVLQPFAGGVLTDVNFGQTETLQVTEYGPANGTLVSTVGNYDPATGVYTVSGSAAVVTAALDGLVFVPTRGQVSPGGGVTTGLSLQDTDTAGLYVDDNDASVTTIAASLAAPSIVAGASASYTTGVSATDLDATLTVTDPEATTLFGAAVAIAAGWQPGDTLSLAAATPGITASFNAATGVLSLSGAASAAAYQSVLDAVVYSSAGGDPTAGDTDNGRTIMWAVNDGITQASAVSTLSVHFASDPAADILLQNGSGQLDLWQLSGAAPVAWGTVGGAAGAGWFAMATGGFFPGDTADVAWQNPTGAIALWQVSGTSVLGGGVLSATPGFSWHIRGAGDFYDDGHSDLLFQNDGGQIVLWDMAGTTILQGGQLSANPGPSWLVKGTGDFYGDGNSDILLQNQDGQATIWDMQGTAIVQGGPVATNPGPSWYIVGTGDFYGDGNSDILWQSADGQMAIWDMQGTTILQGGLLPTDPGPTWHVVSTGDFNNDGKTDIVLQSDNGSLAVWEMDGTSVIGGGTVANPGGGWDILGSDTMQFIKSGAAGETIAATPTTPDEFIFTAAAEGSHTIAGFNAVQDIIELPGSEFATFAAVLAVTSSAPGGTLINLGGGTSLLLAGVSPSALHASNFALT